MHEIFGSQRLPGQCGSPASAGLAATADWLRRCCIAPSVRGSQMDKQGQQVVSIIKANIDCRKDQTVGRDFDWLSGLMLVRRLPAWSGNAGKRLVRAAKVRVPDRGLVHALPGLPDFDAVLGIR